MHGRSVILSKTNCSPKAVREANLIILFRYSVTPRAFLPHPSHLLFENKAKRFPTLRALARKIFRETNFIIRQSDSRILRDWERWEIRRKVISIETNRTRALLGIVITITIKRGGNDGRAAVSERREGGEARQSRGDRGHRSSGGGVVEVEKKERDESAGDRAREADSQWNRWNQCACCQFISTGQSC